MSQMHPEEIVLRALEKNELHLLLLGHAEYQFLPRWSPSPENTDLPILLSWLYGLVGRYACEDLRDRLYDAIKMIVNSYDGLDPVASCVLYESAARSPVDIFGRPQPQNALGLPHDAIAADLRQSIRVFSSRLEKDKTGAGAHWPDGRLGDLRRLSRNTQLVGGPSFFD